MLFLTFIYMGESYYYHYLSQYLPYSFLLNWHKVSNNSKHVQMLTHIFFTTFVTFLKSTELLSKQQTQGFFYFGYRVYRNFKTTFQCLCIILWNNNITKA